MLNYSSDTHYYKSATNLNDQIAKISQIVDALYDLQLEVIGGSDIEEYFIDNGQSKVRTTYRSSQSIAEAITLWENRKTVLMNQLNGRRTRLRPVTWLGKGRRR